MHTKSICLILAIIFVSTLSGCSSDESDDDTKGGDTDDGELDLGGLELDLGGLELKEFASISEKDLKGSWQATFEDGIETLTFEENGAGSFTEEWSEEGESDMQHYSVPMSWEMYGAILSVALAENTTEDGASCTYTQETLFSFAIVNEGIVTSAFLRTAGSGNGHEGTWQSVDGETGEFNCGSGGTERGGNVERYILTLTPDSFEMTREWAFWTESDMKGDTDDNGENTTDTWEGTVTQEDGCLILQSETASASLDRFAVRILSDHVAQLTKIDSEETLFDFFPGDFEAAIYKRQ
ncbi:MAG: hypothetical protein JXX14_10870 [Deltaproteobacteria bacterium]|nr:hypothetical protein [Deltaproteobacteria bacterium]